MSLDIRQSEPTDLTDLREKGRRDGAVIASDRRLYMQLLAFGNCRDTAPYILALQEGAIPGVMYRDLNDPHGIGLLTYSETPDFFVSTLRQVLSQDLFWQLKAKPEFTMFGRTYAIGYESDLEQTLVTRPVQRVTDAQRPWGIWYPVRRDGSFARLSRDEQRTILMEHGGIGRAFGSADLGYDVRLACYGLDRNDNDFVIGLIGRELFPLSSIVQRMRKTRQTSEYLTNLGPFFIGKAIWQSQLSSAISDSN